MRKLNWFARVINGFRTVDWFGCVARTWIRVKEITRFISHEDADVARFSLEVERSDKLLAAEYPGYNLELSQVLQRASGNFELPTTVGSSETKFHKQLPDLDGKKRLVAGTAQQLTYNNGDKITIDVPNNSRYASMMASEAVHKTLGQQ